MKKIFFIFILLIFTFKNNFLLANENKILFKVNNEIITSIDIAKEINYLNLINKDFKNLKKNKSFEIAKDSLIREKIKEIELKKVVEELVVDEKLLNNLSISYFKKQGVNSISDFNNFFKRNDIDPNLIKKKITLEILWNQLIYAKFRQNIKIDKNQIKKSLLNNNKQKEYLLSEILFNINDNEKLIEKYEIIKKDINEKNFSGAAIIHSISDSVKNGGNIGWVKETFLSPNIKKKLVNLENGDITSPIVIPGGFLILKIENTREIDVEFDLEQEIQNIIKKKTNEQLNQLSNIYFNKIKKNIEVNEL